MTGSNAAGNDGDCFFFFPWVNLFSIRINRIKSITPPFSKKYFIHQQWMLPWSVLWINFLKWNFENNFHQCRVKSGKQIHCFRFLKFIRILFFRAELHHQHEAVVSALGKMENPHRNYFVVLLREICAYETMNVFLKKGLASLIYEKSWCRNFFSSFRQSIWSWTEAIQFQLWSFHFPVSFPPLSSAP